MQKAVSHCQKDRRSDSSNGEDPHQPPRLNLEWCWSAFHRTERLSDTTDFGSRSGRRYLRDSSAANNQAARSDVWSVVAARPRVVCLDRADTLSHGNRFACQQGLIRFKICPGEQPGISRNAITFGNDNKISDDDLASGNALAHSVPNHESPGAGHVLEGSERAFRPALLDNHETNVQHSECKEDERFSQIANDEIDNTRSEQKLEHWFANGISNNTQRPTLALLRKFIPPVAAKSRGCLAGGETTL